MPKEMKPAMPAAASKGVVFLAWGLPAAKTLAEAGITEVSVSSVPEIMS